MGVHVVIMGCGRVGTALAHALTAAGHTVAVIDRDTKPLERLGDNFTGQKVIGVGFDRDTLLEAGIERAGAFAAVSNGDNSNIIAARVARETYGIERVVARIYDPGRAEVYSRLGIPTVATVRWTSDQILRRLLPEHASDDWHDPSGNVIVAELACAPGRILTIDMLNLVDVDRDGTLQRICDFLNLPITPEFRAWFNENVRLEDANVGRWRTQFDAETVKKIDSVYAEMVERVAAAGAQVPLPS